jgi:Holliday junction resolvase RusA-like endonuclease
VIQLPFPPSSLSGHAKGHWRSKSGPTAKYREYARLAALEARPNLPTQGDIALHVHFVPPDRRGDRVNFWNRCKPYFDGIAEALSINDARFVPSMSFAEPQKPGRVEIRIAA